MRGDILTSSSTAARVALKLTLFAACGMTVGCRSMNKDASNLTVSAVGFSAPESIVPASPQAVAQVGFDDLIAPDEILRSIDSEPSLPLKDYLQLESSSDFATAAVPFVDDPAIAKTPSQAESLTLQELEATALASHPAIAQARAHVDSTRGRYVQAGLPFNPILQYQSDEIGNERSSGLHSIQLSQQFVTANKLGIAQQVQAREIQKQQAQLRIAELRVLTRIRAAFARTIVSQQRTELTDQIVELSEKSVSSVVLLVEAKEVSHLELLQAKVETERARIAAENAATQLKANRRSLAAAAGMRTLPPVRLHGELTENLQDTPWEELLAEISAMSPEISGAGSELERARWSLQLACAQVTPNITSFVGVGVDTGTDDTYGRFGVTVPLPIRNRNQGNIRSARADIAAASAAIDKTMLSLDSRLAAAVGRYQMARERYERLQTRVVPNATETFDLSRRAFDAGETGYLQLLTTQRTLFATRLSVLDALGQAKEARAEIDGLLVTLQP